MSEEAIFVLYRENFLQLAAPGIESSFVYRKIIDALQNVRVAINLNWDPINRYARYGGTLFHFQKLAENQRVRRSCHIELEGFDAWTQPYLKTSLAKLFDEMTASLSVFRTVHIEVRHRAGLLSITGTDWKWSCEDCNPVYELTCKHRNQGLKRRSSVFEELKEMLTQKL